MPAHNAQPRAANVIDLIRRQQLGRRFKAFPAAAALGSRLCQTRLAIPLESLLLNFIGTRPKSFASIGAIDGLYVEARSGLSSFKTMSKPQHVLLYPITPILLNHQAVSDTRLSDEQRRQGGIVFEFLPKLREVDA